ncbi:MAG: single-stranded nucleic acid binding R3H domain-containing protein, spoIIIJ-associated protein [Candidatus Gottesmanbacteria bacterium GW2011_GWA2_43_14]|uniref:Single-stranded nucleic acid binding R3H domain-containing protein, spoIIIJ-associated protein n=1 Tax=Candidatus Gottesmanbacteria bacterium GW2011_GWA2_43_14 TaxID=1618443 RepID=A0A0G1FSB3_9BACT|nr:MAG: single-stranded nucleic acid binding R3H domain-containing protein, spoIIIJ-associated protein [Candidatus Gottesmanbacteria bacterium GW2011_GWA2_43_14]
MKKKKANHSKLIKQSVEELLLKLKVEGKVEVEEVEAGENSHYQINIESPETGLLIGYHGETINSLQLLLGVILYKKLGEWVRVVMDVGEYRKMREESIKEMVDRIIAEVERTGESVEMPYLSPLERRIVHMILTEHKTLTSQSHGEGRDRRVTIKPR